MYKRYLQFPPLLAATLLLAAIAAAQEPPAEEPPRRYAVEIILFRYADSVPTGNELFRPEAPAAPDEFGLPGDDEAFDDDGEVPAYGDLPAFVRDPEPFDPPPGLDAAGPGDAGEADPDSAVELAEILLPANVVGLRVTPREALTLAKAWEQLERLDAYQPVLWTGWTQAAVARSASPEIELRRLGNAPPEFDGRFQLYLSRFLHLVVDLTLTPRSDAAGGAVPVYRDGRRNFARNGTPGLTDAGVVRLRINEDRIVKSGDLRYFDHPRFGLLAKVTRVEDNDDDDPVAGPGVPAGR